MSKRKTFTKTDISIPVVQYVRDSAGAVVIPLDVIPPRNTTVKFNCGTGAGATQFDFGPWYGLGIDQIVYPCQKQIERFLDGQDKEVTDVSIRTYCQSGLAGFFDYLEQLRIARRRDLTLADVNRDCIDGYIGALKDTGTSRLTQKNHYTNSKSVLKSLCKRGLISEIRSGDEATFPRNPFSGLGKRGRGERPLPKAQRQAFATAVKKAVLPLFDDEVEPTSELVAYALLVVALHTGRNTWPLLEMSRDCLRAHPKNDRLFLVLYKRRGHTTSKVAVRADDNETELAVQSMPTVRPSVGRLIRRVIELSERLIKEAPAELRNRVWLYRTRALNGELRASGDISALNPGTLERSIKLLVKRYELVDTDGKPLRITVSRLRKTFVNRIYEILGGDIVETAAAAGDTVRVTDVDYLRPGESAQKNWKFMGMALVTELLTKTLGATERTPIGRCTDLENGQFAPKKDREPCMSFLDCLRCRNYVVTAEDLHRLFSFYWRLFSERARMSPKKWHRQFAHIVRLIDRDVIEAGIAKGVFKRDAVDKERERARVSPHPFWQSETIIPALAEGLA